MGTHGPDASRAALGRNGRTVAFGRDRCAPLLAALALACSSPPPAPNAPIDAAVSLELHEVWRESRRPGFASLAGPLPPPAAAGDWPAFPRLADEFFHRSALALPERYGHYLAAMEGGSAAGAYLAGRLGGPLGDARLRRAVELDPSLSWGWHGLAWRSFQVRDTDRAIREGQRALRLARDPLECALFSWALATYLRAAERPSSAQGVLGDALQRTGPLALRPAERTYIEALLAAIELESLDTKEVRRGVRRALDVIGRVDASERERFELTLTLSTDTQNIVTAREIEFAVLRAADASSGEARERTLQLYDGLRSRVADDGRNGEPPLGTQRALLLAGFEGAARGDLAPAIDAWLAELPECVLAEDGLPRRPELRAVVGAVRSYGVDPRSAAALAGLGEALLGAGWFDETDALAGAALSEDPGEKARAVARGLQSRAARARAALAAVSALARRIDAREAFEQAGAVGSNGVDAVEGERLSELVEVRDEIGRILQAYGLATEGEVDESPRIRYGPVGSVLHPGPRFTAEDERLGRGRAGEEVHGLSELFRRLGRFALIGNGAGQGGPDATVLRILYVEERAGEHLGRPFRGTVFWCQGADVPSRFGRAGASISGAALHEGYYVDLEMVEREKARWDALRERFAEDPAAVDAALAARGASTRFAVRREFLPALGANDRMRLAVMRRPDGTLREITLGELAEIVAIHEEGHLCDRGRWYPLTAVRVLRVLSLGFAHWFQGSRIAQALEERAQLVALAAAPDSRLAWVDILDAAEGAGGGSVTPHSTAYRRILRDLLARLEDEFNVTDAEADPDAPLTGLDPGVRWIDQLHRLSPEALGGLARREARARELATRASIAADGPEAP